VVEDGDPISGAASLADEAAPILDELTTRWGLGPHPRQMWFEIESAAEAA